MGRAVWSDLLRCLDWRGCILTRSFGCLDTATITILLSTISFLGERMILIRPPLQGKCPDSEGAFP